MLNYKKINLLFVFVIATLLAFSFFINTKWWWFLAIIFVRFIILVIGSSFISLNFHLKAYCNNPSEKEKVIAITFDDGPNENTPLVLDLLSKYKAKATFFCIGKNIEKYPDILRAIYQQGSDIGNHSYSHSHFFDFFRKNRILEELNQTDTLITKLINKKPLYFRPPYGVTNPSIRKALQESKHTVIGWNIRSMDGITSNEELILNRIKNRISPGSIILLHDTSIQSVRVLEQLLLFLQQNKYQVISVSQLLNLKVYEN
jgi:peptidoglycan/xylan/chitin deacetylase (PgdA/CDA1 family)